MTTTFFKPRQLELVTRKGVSLTIMLSHGGSFPSHSCRSSMHSPAASQEVPPVWAAFRCATLA
ncbi:hypothetical protein PR048_011443, partial [Dryococelus australis]